jgi:C-terminal processing protease CtpA/Prc
MQIIYVTFLCFCAVLSSVMAQADTVHFKTHRQVKGVVVDEYHDRIVLSTYEGEKQIMRSDIDHIEYDDEEYYLLSMGRQREVHKRWQEAIAFYEEALLLNPNLLVAKQAIVGIRSRMWAKTDEKRINEISKQGAIRDSWRANVALEDVQANAEKDLWEILWGRMGMDLTQRGDWTLIRRIKRGGEAQNWDLKKGDVLMGLDGKSLGFVGKDAITRLLLEPRYSNATLVFQRRFKFDREQSKKGFKNLGFGLKQSYDGLSVEKIKSESLAETAGIRAGDILMEVDGIKTRYLSLDAAQDLLVDGEGGPAVLKFNRTVTITRK